MRRRRRKAKVDDEVRTWTPDSGPDYPGRSNAAVLFSIEAPNREVAGRRLNDLCGDIIALVEKHHPHVSIIEEGPRRIEALQNTLAAEFRLIESVAAEQASRN